jgi:hypothetical protein
MKIRLKAPAGLESTGIYGKDGKEMPVGHEMEVADDFTGWNGRFDILSGGPAADSEAVTNSAYKVETKGGGYYVVTKDGEPLSKSLRKDDLDGFDGLTDEDKAAFVELNKKEA